MPTTGPAATSTAVPALGAALRDLALAVHALQLYPSESPVVKEAVGKAHRSLAPALHDGPVSLAIHPETIRIGNEDPGQGGRAVGELARRLHRRGVAHLHLDSNIETDTLQLLAELLAVDVDTLLEQGGIDAARKRRQMPGVGFEMLQLDRLYEDGVEPDAADDGEIWKRILETYGGEAAEIDWEALAAEPRQLGDFLDWLLDDQRSIEGSSELSRIQLVRTVCERTGEAAAHLGQDRFEAVAGVVAELYPKLDKEVWIDLIGQRLPIAERYEADDADGDLDLTRSIGASLTGAQVEDLLVYALSTREHVSARIVGLFRRLLQDRADRDAVQGAIRAALDRSVAADPGRSFDELWPQLNEVLHGESPDLYVSSTYRASLERLLVDGRTADVWDLERIGPRMEELRPAYVVQRKAKVVLAALPTAIDDEEYRGLARELERALPELVIDGQYIATEEVLNTLTGDLAPTSGRNDNQRETAREILVRFCNPHTLREVVRNLAGRQRTQIEAGTRIFATLGQMAVPALLEALAEERSRARRAHLVRMLAAVGDQALPEIRKHLRDRRWFFVRNLVWIIGEVGAETLTPHLDTIINHPDPRVRREAIRAAAKLRNDSAVRHLIEAIDDVDDDVRLLAIRGLGLARAGAAAERLAELLTLPNLRGQNTELIRAAAVALGRLGETRALGPLHRIARAPWLFRARRMKAAEAAAWAIATICGETREAAPEAVPVARRGMPAASGARPDSRPATGTAEPGAA